MHQVLPTGNLAAWTVTALLDSLVTELSRDTQSDSLTMFFYAVTSSGWEAIKKPVLEWKTARDCRSVTMFAGTDHALTDPTALMEMQQHGIDIRIMRTYRGVFHPKVLWLKGDKTHVVWTGSNNLTRDGLRNNVEFAVIIKSEDVPRELQEWAEAVKGGSVPLTASLLNSYTRERNKFEKGRAARAGGTFTWSKKQEPEQPGNLVRTGDLILEIMPQETRGGNQVQVPRAAANQFFGLDRVGQHAEIFLQPWDSEERRRLIIRVFQNWTVRISVNELELRDRPCVMIFRNEGGSRVLFEIVSKSVFPTRYRLLLARCNRQTRKGSRRWTIV